MAWESVTWACGHTGQMQLYGKISARESRVAYEAGRKCMACWLVERWEAQGDPRAQRTDRYKLAAAIAETKGKRIENLPDEAPVVSQAEKENLLAKFSSAELRAELARRDAEYIQEEGVIVKFQSAKDSEQ